MYDKKYIKTKFATTENELYNTMKEAFGLGLFVEVVQHHPVNMVYRHGQTTFEIRLYNPIILEGEKINENR